MTDPGPDILQLLGLKVSHIILGILGGVVRWIIAPQRSFWRNVGASLVSLITVIIGTPVMSPIVSYYFTHLFPDPRSLDGAVGFALGVTGYSLVSGMIKFSARWAENPTLPPK